MLGHQIILEVGPRFSWLPEARSTLAGDHDVLFYFIFWVSVFFLALICGLLVMFAVQYRHRGPGAEFVHGTKHNTPLEVTWTVIPLLIALVMFYWGLRNYVAMANPPPGAYEIKVEASMWSWNFGYPGGLEHNELHCWKGQPVRLVMRSNDVIHSFFVPAFRVKMDVVPGRRSRAWFEATEAGTYRLFCAEYCGVEHYNMKTVVVVHETREEFESWLSAAGVRPEGTPLADWGKVLYERKGCKSCHSLDGSLGQGPSWKETASLYEHESKQRYFENSDPETVTAEYIRESIMSPKLKIVKNFGRGNMPFRKLSEDEIDSIIEFIKTLDDSGQ